MACALHAGWLRTHTHTHTQHILISFPLQQWLHESASMLRHMYTACLVIHQNQTGCVLLGHVPQLQRQLCGKTQHVHYSVFYPPPSIAVSFTLQQLCSVLCANRTCNLSRHTDCTQKQQNLLAVLWYAFYLRSIHAPHIITAYIYNNTAGSSETSMHVYQTRRHHIQDDLNCTT